MANANKVSDNMREYSEHVLSKLDKEINELREKSIATEFDRKLTKRLSSK